MQSHDNPFSSGNERSNELQRVRQERDRLAAELKLAHQAIEVERNLHREAYEELVQLERARAFQEIARGIEHDLYNALTPIEGYSELLLMDPRCLADPQQARTYLQSIANAANEAKNVIAHVREFFYSSSHTDIRTHGEVSRVLAKALGEQGPSLQDEPDPDDYVSTESLSPREWDVLKLLADGLRNREIAEALNVSENTVKTHIKAILSKLNLKNRTQAAAYALLDQQAYAP